MMRCLDPLPSSCYQFQLRRNVWSERAVNAGSKITRTIPDLDNQRIGLRMSLWRTRKTRNGTCEGKRKNAYLDQPIESPSKHVVEVRRLIGLVIA